MAGCTTARRKEDTTKYMERRPRRDVAHCFHLLHVSHITALMLVSGLHTLASESHNRQEHGRAGVKVMEEYEIGKLMQKYNNGRLVQEYNIERLAASPVFSSVYTFLVVELGW